MWAVAILVFLGTIPLMRIAHEIGYAVVARALGARVDTLALGIGPRVARIGRVELRLVPLWAYASTSGRPSLPSRVVGSVAALVFAYGAVTAPIFIQAVAGWPTIVGTTVIGDVIPGMPADEAGLRPGDRVLSIGGQPVESMEDIIDGVRPSGGQHLDLEVNRRGERLSVELVPDQRYGRGTIGIVTREETVMEPLPADEAAEKALLLYPTIWWLRLNGILRTMAVSPPYDLTGPVGMGRRLPPRTEPSPFLVMIMMSSPLVGLMLLLHLLLPVPGFALHRVLKGRK